jgi:ligand-binding sensor domain-containing protein
MRHIAFIGTLAGMFRFDPASGERAHYSTRDGLASNVIDTCFADKSGKLWFGTAQGDFGFVPSPPESAAGLDYRRPFLGFILSISILAASARADMYSIEPDQLHVHRIRLRVRAHHPRWTIRLLIRKTAD